MANFLTKLFRRKVPATDDKKTKKDVKRPSSTKSSKSKSKSITKASSQPVMPEVRGPDDEGTMRRQASFTATSTSGRGSSVGREQSSSEHKRVLSPRNNRQVLEVIEKPLPFTTVRKGPIDLDDTDFDESDHDENKDRSNEPRLSFQQLQQFNLQQHPNTNTQNANHLYQHSPPKDPRKLGRMSDAQAAAMEDMANKSDCSSSDFNLSTDAEDTEYNNLRRRGAPPLNNSGLDTSGMSSPTNYTTDEERAIFPALQNDDDATTKEDPPARNEKPDHIKIVPMAHETEDDIRAWTVSPRQNGSKENQHLTTSTSPRFEQFSRSFPATSSPATDFGNFANFDSFDSSPFHTTARQSENAARPASRAFLVDTPDFPKSQRRHISSSSSAAHPESSLSDLLAQAKLKSSRRKASASSVNSAPVITAQYLRQQHKLRSISGSAAERDSRSVDKTTSVSDIIQSLEATNASRLKNSSRTRPNRPRDPDSLSHASNGGSVRSSKDRIREKTRQERNRPSGSDESDNEEAESWLFDEVTGTLGPRGVAADMESLSGRSKNSSGNKSHRSHKSHKSHRSHRSSRRKKSSNESVDSRNSRYSHRSTKSYLSQMSEQSRSVANDLLRLEMQLAMVGSQENGEDTGRGPASLSGSIGGASRASRTSRASAAPRRTSAITKRSRMTVIAPPGKLGIILANKADSKGTVVSGVRTSSVLAEKISPGDRIIAIDGEDVSRMTVSEITTIMARKSDFERSLTVLTTPKHLGISSGSLGQPSQGQPSRSPTRAGDYNGSAADPDGFYRR